MPLRDKKIRQGATVCGGAFDVRRLCVCAMLLGVSMLLSYLEHLFPLDLLVPLPGIRLGWAQIAITVAYFFVGRTEAAMVSGARVILMGLLFGTGMSFCFSVCGALLSYCGLFLGERLYRRCSYFGLGMICAVLHNIGRVGCGSVFRFHCHLVLFAGTAAGCCFHGRNRWYPSEYGGSAVGAY